MAVPDETGSARPQPGALEGRQADQDRTLEAMHLLERALAAPAPGREAPWRDDVLASLAVLDDATTEEYENGNRSDSLLSDIKRTQPRLGPRVRGVRAQYSQLRDRVRALRQELAADPEEPPDFADIRERLAALLTAIRHQRARESDLLYEAYFDAFNSDLRSG
jgi:DNA repair ATPase RecN